MMLEEVRGLSQGHQAGDRYSRQEVRQAEDEQHSALQFQVPRWLCPQDQPWEFRAFHFQIRLCNSYLLSSLCASSVLSTEN